MLYLYLGYLLVQSYWLINKLANTELMFFVIIFSVIVVFVWSLIPVAGYAIAKLLKLGRDLAKPVNFAVGLSVGLLENALFYFNILSKDQNLHGVLSVFILCFMIRALSNKLLITRCAS